MDRIQLPSSSSLLRFLGYRAESELLVSQFWPTGSMLVASGQFGLTSSHFRCDANQKFGSGPSEPAGFQNAARRELQLAPGSSFRQSCGIEEIFLASPGHSTWGVKQKAPALDGSLMLGNIHTVCHHTCKATDPCCTYV